MNTPGVNSSGMLLPPCPSVLFARRLRRWHEGLRSVERLLNQRLIGDLPRHQGGDAADVHGRLRGDAERDGARWILRDVWEEPHHVLAVVRGLREEVRSE